MEEENLNYKYANLDAVFTCSIQIFFSELITDCLHDEEIKFTNATNLEIDGKSFIAELLGNLKFACQETELEELFQQEHFHLIHGSHIKKKIKRLVDNPYSNFNKLCQIPLDKEMRLYGNLQKIKHSNLYIFKSLILDPNHLIYNEQKFNKLKNLTCLFAENDCLETRKTGLKKKR